MAHPEDMGRTPEAFEAWSNRPPASSQPAPLRPPFTEACGQLVDGQADQPCQREKGHGHPYIHVGPWRQEPASETAPASTLAERLTDLADHLDREHQQHSAEHRREGVTHPDSALYREAATEIESLLAVVAEILQLCHSDADSDATVLDSIETVASTALATE